MQSRIPARPVARARSARGRSARRRARSVLRGARIALRSRAVRAEPASCRGEAASTSIRGDDRRLIRGRRRETLEERPRKHLGFFGRNRLVMSALIADRREGIAGECPATDGACVVTREDEHALRKREKTVERFTQRTRLWLRISARV